MTILARSVLAALLLFTLTGCQAFTRECHYASTNGGDPFTIIISNTAACEPGTPGYSELVP